MKYVCCVFVAVHVVRMVYVGDMYVACEPCVGGSECSIHKKRLHWIRPLAHLVQLPVPHNGPPDASGSTCALPACGIVRLSTSIHTVCKWHV